MRGVRHSTGEHHTMRQGRVSMIGKLARFAVAVAIGAATLIVSAPTASAYPIDPNLTCGRIARQAETELFWYNWYLQAYDDSGLVSFLQEAVEHLRNVVDLELEASSFGCS